MFEARTNPQADLHPTLEQDAYCRRCRRSLALAETRRGHGGPPSELFTASGAGHPDLGRKAVHDREGVEELGQRSVGARQQLDSGAGRRDRVVEAEPALGEEHVPRHLARRARPPSCFIFALMREWPTFHDDGAALPWRLMSSNSAWLHLTRRRSLRLPHRDVRANSISS